MKTFPSASLQNCVHGKALFTETLSSLAWLKKLSSHLPGLRNSLLTCLAKFSPTLTATLLSLAWPNSHLLSQKLCSHSPGQILTYSHSSSALTCLAKFAPTLTATLLSFACPKMASRPTTADEKSAEAAKIAAFKLHEAEVETQEEWDELMALQGLVVIDVYQVKKHD